MEDASKANPSKFPLPTSISSPPTPNSTSKTSGEKYPAPSRATRRRPMAVIPRRIASSPCTQNHPFSTTSPARLGTARTSLRASEPRVVQSSAVRSAGATLRHSGKEVLIIITVGASGGGEGVVAASEVVEATLLGDPGAEEEVSEASGTGRARCSRALRPRLSATRPGVIPKHSGTRRASRKRDGRSHCSFRKGIMPTATQCARGGLQLSF